tara:strand:- start:196 stop:456 length:261 start_codon:yes stop_codon:yes gene_type:complete
MKRTMNKETKETNTQCTVETKTKTKIQQNDKKQLKKEKKKKRKKRKKSFQSILNDILKPKRNCEEKDKQKILQSTGGGNYQKVVHI